MAGSVKDIITGGQRKQSRVFQIQIRRFTGKLRVVAENLLDAACDDLVSVGRKELGLQERRDVEDLMFLGLGPSSQIYLFDADE